MRKIQGLVAAVLTPLKPDGSINLSQIAPYVKHLLSMDVRNVFVNGTSGESMLLTVEERKEIAAAWIDCKTKGLENVLVQCGTENSKNTKELIVHAESIGADGVAVVCPAFFRCTSAENVVTYLSEVASVVKDIPFYYYHIPLFNHTHVKARDVVRLAQGGRVKNFAGLKFTDMDLSDACLASQYDCEVFIGFEQLLLGAMSMGMTSCIGGCVNFAGRPIHRMRQYFLDGNLARAREEQIRLQKFIELTLRDRLNAGTFKAVMKILTGLDLGPPRLPAEPMPMDQYNRLALALDNDQWAQWLGLGQSS